MRSPAEDMTVADWMEAKTAMNANAFKQLVRVARAGGIELPAGLVPGFNPRITFDGLSDSAAYERVKDVEALNKFNAAVNQWASRVESELKASAQSSFGHRSGSSDKFPSLASSIKANVRKDKNYRLETRSVGFSMARHGVYMYKGAGTGHGGFKGGKWTDQYGTLKTTDPESIGKMNTENRQSVDWFNSVINGNIEELIAIVADYSLDITVNLNSILIPE